MSTRLPSTVPSTNMSSDVCHVVAIPYPGRGHINPMLNLCLLLASKPNITITFVVTEEWLGFLNSDSTPLPPNLNLVSIPNVIPSEKGRAGNFNGFLQAVFTKMEAPIEELLDQLEPKPRGLLADTYLPWVVRMGGRRGLKVYSLFTMSASFFRVIFELVGHVELNDKLAEADIPLSKYIIDHNYMQSADLQSLSTVTVPLKIILEVFSWVRKAHCLLFTSFHDIEVQVVEALQANLSCPVYTVGPSVPYMMLKKKQIKPNGSNIDYINWLDSQRESSVLYVSLGSFLSVSGPQMDEIAMGLRLSRTQFLWVARGDCSRLQEMIGGAGLVAPWCDQLSVLSHPSVGGFLTHCGWNSTLEGLFTGVPMLTFPIFWDQPIDSRLIVDDWKVGLSLKTEVGKEGIVGREEIAKVVKKFMDLDGSESNEMRRRSKELRLAAHNAIKVDGPSYQNLNSFVRIIMEGDDC